MLKYDKSLPVDLKGESLCALLGARSSALELFLIKRKIKGPSWLQVSNYTISVISCNMVKIDTPMLASEWKRPGMHPSNGIQYRGHRQKHFTVIRKLDGNIFPMGFNTEVTDRNTKAGALLSRLMLQLHKLDSDVLVGHNISGFDLDVLLHRSQACRVPSSMWSKLGVSTVLRCLSWIEEAKHLVLELIRLSCLVLPVSYSLTHHAKTQLNQSRKEVAPHEVPKMFQTAKFLMELVESFKTFNQRYFINFKYWGGANSSTPIFVTFGGEAALEVSQEYVGFIEENAASFKALLVYIEHRYYGKSVPFGTKEEVLKNIGYFNSAQALADYADVIIHIKKILHAESSPVVVIGGSYSGMLASWFRLKYPHLAIGALASSAPILFMDDMIQPNAFMDAVSKDFKEESQTCYEAISNSWSEIEKVASQPNGLSILSQRFNSCNPLNQTLELSSYLETVYAYAAQYNDPPVYPVTEICDGIDRASFGNNILDKIYSGVVAFHRGVKTCHHMNFSTNIHEMDLEWGWQRCSEIVIPFGKGKDSMFQPQPFDLKSFVEKCKKDYGVSPRTHWISTYYGGQDIKLILKRFGSNIIFSNGLKDPFSSGGILSDLSKSLVAIPTINGSHCLDLYPSKQSDPGWLIEQRKKELKIIHGWIAQYYSDLGAH
ncbi:lysosomal Pro-X carboxypeptidase [Trifolium repens]|nr:lysosomal Pro-X carboxypeptidase [Trifolium repens]